MLGRLASEIASILMGKNSVNYTPSACVGKSVVVTNASKIKVTGKKALQKVYYRHSRFPGGLKETAYKVMIERHPERIITAAVKGMLPRNKLGKKMLTQLRVFRGDTHTHEAQNPVKIEIENAKEK